MAAWCCAGNLRFMSCCLGHYARTLFCCQYTQMLMCPQHRFLALVSCRCVSTSVLYGVHALISGVLTYKTHCIRQLVRNMPQLDI